VKEFSTFDRIIGLVGLILSVPVFLEFFRARFVNGLLLIILMLLITGYLGYRWLERRRVKDRSLFTFLEVEKTFVFSDGQPQVCKHATSVVAQANHTGLTHIWFRNLAADGGMGNFQIDGVSVPPALIRKTATGYDVGKEFPHPLKSGEERKVTLTYDYTDSFLDNRESVTHIVLAETRKLKMTVKFHPSRIGREPTFLMETGGGIADVLATPTSLANGCLLEVQRDALKIGAHYTLEWVW